MPILLDLPKIHFDFGAVSSLPDELAELNIKRPLIVTDRNLVECGVLKKALSALPVGNTFPIFDEIPENPTVDGIEKACEVYLQEGCDGIVAVGGGSVIDSSKGIALRAAHPAPISQYEGHSEKITESTAPIISIPTTAGTGSEITFGAGIHTDPSTPSMNIRSPHFVPKVAICDPDLTMTLPPSLTASTGMDALGQCLEAYLARGKNPVIDAIALNGAKRAFDYIERAVADGSDKDARWNMLMAALEGGIGIHKGLGSVHAMANTFGDQGFNHGIIVAVALPSVLRFLEDYAADRLDDLATLLDLENRDQLPATIEELNRRLGLPVTLGELGYVINDIDQAAELCVQSGFNNTAPHAPTHEQYKGLLKNATG
jgi:4-hydroxybutyrate dehydrogenase